MLWWCLLVKVALVEFGKLGGSLCEVNQQHHIALLGVCRLQFLLVLVLALFVFECTWRWDVLYLCDFLIHEIEILFSGPIID